MAILIPNEGKVQLLTYALAGGTLESWTLKLMKTSVTPGPTNTSASYTEADFTGYAAKTLTHTVSGSTWSTPASGAPDGSWSPNTAVGESQYNSGSPQVFTCTGTGNTVYGYFIVGATSGKVIAAELFPTARVLSNGDSLSMIPYLGAADVDDAG